ncbi:hypothetical protein KJ758_00580 [Patescibacteria group bacterium]|nr:hypothetical protein [Patescibacteria group bacterium]
METPALTVPTPFPNLDLEIERFVEDVAVYRASLVGYEVSCQAIGPAARAAKGTPRGSQQQIDLRLAKQAQKQARIDSNQPRHDFESACVRFEKTHVPVNRLTDMALMLGEMSSSGWPEVKEAVEAQRRIADVGIAIIRSSSERPN